MILPLLGGTLSAWHGHRIHGGDPKWIKNLAWTIPFFVIALMHLPFGWPVFLTLLCLLKGTGHGRGFDLHDPMKEGSKRERVEYLIFWLEKKIPLYWYKVLIMSLTGLAAVSGAVLAFGLHNPMDGLILAVGGLFKGINAILFNKDTAVREYADGVAAYSALWMVI